MSQYNNTPLIDQYTVTVGSPTVPVLAAGFAGPFQVINLSNEATVWLADSTNVSNGKGIPLNPGTGLIWTGSQGTQKMYAILGTDSQSVGKTANIVIGGTVRDYQANPVAIALAVLNTGLILVDNPVEILNTGAVVLNVGNNPIITPDIDVSTYQSIIIQVNLTVNTLVPATGAFTLSFGWEDSNGNTLGNDAYKWISGDISVLQTVLPIRGSRLSITAGFGGGGASAVNYTLRVVASHRLYQDQMKQQGVAGNRVLVSGNAAALASGAALTVTPSVRYDGPMIVTASGVAAAAATQPIDISVNDLVTGFRPGYDFNVGFLALGGAREAINLHTVAPRNSWSVSLGNLGALAQSVTIQVTAAPEGT